MQSTILNAHIAALKKVVSVLTEHKIPHQITGGFAGNIYGSLWPPHDIDVEVTARDMPLVAELFTDYITQPLHHFINNEFDLWLIRLNIDGIEIDFNQAEECYVINRAGQKQLLCTDLNTAEEREFMGIKVSVQPLNSLIAYKTALGREADVADLSLLLLMANK
jgi:hypothetical protein